MWAGVALSIIIVLLFLVQRRAEDTRMQTVWQEKYRRTRMQIGLHLMHLRHEYGTSQMHVSQNTALDIRELWNDRDVLFQVINKRMSPFSADSLATLEQLIDRHAPLTTVLKEIERIERMNETN